MPVRAGEIPDACAEAARADGFTGEAGTLCEMWSPAPIILAGVGAAPDKHALEEAGARAVARLLRHGTIRLDLRGWKKSHAAAFTYGVLQRAWWFTLASGAAAAGGPEAPRPEALRGGLKTRLEDETLLLRCVHVQAEPGFEAAWAGRAAVLQGVSLARALVTEPANTLTPQGFLAALAPLREAGCSIETISGAALAPFGGITTVGRASPHEPVLAVIRWTGTLETPPVAFVGKGITFDTGGICIKPADKMWDMRADMAGAAACAGALLTLALRRSPAPAMAVLALAENAIGADAYRPGDVIRAYNGSTVEVVDTDAEGRLVLMDALAWAAAQKPQAMIDAATLTGSIVVALGHHQAGLFGSDPGLSAAVSAAGAAVGERVWQMPLTPGYRRALESDIADLRHCSPLTRQPDACHAAAFLREFTGGVPWAHLDIAGVESREAADEAQAAGATGWGVRLFNRLVRDRFEDPHRV